MGGAYSTAGIEKGQGSVDRPSKPCRPGRVETVLSGLSTINEGGGGEALTGALNRYPGEGVGFYAILQGSLMAGANSQINFTNGPFEIRPKPFETPVIPDIPVIVETPGSIARVPSSAMTCRCPDCRRVRTTRTPRGVRPTVSRRPPAAPAKLHRIAWWPGSWPGSDLRAGAQLNTSTGESLRPDGWPAGRRRRPWSAQTAGHLFFFCSFQSAAFVEHFHRGKDGEKA